MTWLLWHYLRAFFMITCSVAIVLSIYETPRKPVILVPPQDLTITTQNATITCISTGSRPLSVNWMKDGQRLNVNAEDYLSQSFDGSLYIFFATMKRDQGLYRCIVGNSVGSIISQEAFVSFPVMDDFVTPDSEVTVNEGSRALLQCHSPNSFPDKFIYWSKYDPLHPNHPINLQSISQSHYSVDKNGDLYFPYTKDSDAGGYYCNVENHYIGEVKRRTVALVVNPVKTQHNHPPRIWNFASQTTVVGDRLTIECISQGRPTPKMKMVHVNSNREVGSRMGNIQRYSINRVSSQHNGEYTCEVANEFGETESKSASVTLEARPMWVIYPVDKATDIGSSVTLHCMASGTPRVSYTWFYNGTRLLQSSDYSIAGGNLTIQSVLPFHAGMYQCLASNKHGTILESSRLRVVEIPAGFGIGSLAPKENTHVLVDAIAELTCNPTGSPRPVIRWRHEGRKEEIINTNHYQIMPSGNLRIKSVKKNDEGFYTCTVTNKLSQDRRRGYLSVREGVAIVEAPETQEIVLGNAANLTCRVLTSADLEVSFRWFKNGRPVKESTRVAILNEEDRRTVLQFGSADFTDSGRYECRATATDISGTADSQTAFITIVGPPGQPTDVKITNVKGRNPRLTWMLGRDNGKPVTAVYIQSRTTSMGLNWRTLKVLQNISFSGVIDLMLPPWTSFKFRVISTNAVGNSTPSLETSSWLHTPPASPSSYPKSAASTGTGPREMTITWQVLPKSEENGPGIYYLVHHRQSHLQTGFYADKVQNGLSSFVLKGAEYYTEYEFRLQAGNAMGLGPLSPVMRGYTGERLPLGAPKELQVQITSSRTASAQWKGVKDSRHVMRGEFRGYKLLFWIDSLLETSPDLYYKTTRDNETTLTLAPATPYLFQVVAYNKIGNGPGSNIIGPLMTPEDAPTKPIRVWVSYAEMGMANVSWTLPEKSNGMLVRHTLRYRPTADGTILSTKTAPASQLWMILSNLQHGTAYQFSVSSSTKAGEGPTNTITFDFTQLPLAKPSNVEVTAIGIDTIVLTWSPINQADIIGYKVYYWRQGDDQSVALTLTEQNNDILTPISSLRSDTTYLFQVAGLNEYGAGPRTDPLQIVTLPRAIKKPVSSTARFGASALVTVLCTITSMIAATWTINLNRQWC